MNFDAVIHPLHPRSVFRVSHGDRTEVRNVFVRFQGAGITGCGEASPNAVYGESADDVLARLRRAADWLRGQEVRSVSDIARIWAESWPMLAPSRAAQCAIDLALWDWLGRREGRTVAELAWWSAFMKTRGFRDDLAERLAQRKAESGLTDRADIVTFMDYIDADEGRI